MAITDFEKESAGGGGSLDEKVKVSATDTTEDFLLSKLQAGLGISVVAQNVGANENILITNTLGLVNTI